MRKNLLYVFLFFIALAGCKAKKHIAVEIPIAEPLPIVADTTLLPTFPAQVLYVLGREYEELIDENNENALSPEVREMLAADSSAMEEYVENRLIELYPEKAYKGVVKKIIKKAGGLISIDKKITVPEHSELSFLQQGFAAGEVEKFKTYVSLQDEIEFMNMNTAEQEIYWRLNALAENPGQANISDFDFLKKQDSLAVEESTPPLLEENLLMACLFSGGAYAFYRIIQSKMRAEHVAEQYYPGSTSSGKKGDAFKHLLVNVLLRRYLTEDIAYLVMDLSWERRGNNAPCDKYMDLHNNHVGRNSRYWYFRGNLSNDRNWKNWASRIHSFVEDSVNSTKKGWDHETLEYIIIKDQQVTDKTKYIYWNEVE